MLLVNKPVIGNSRELSGAWWWLGIPVSTMIALPVIHWVAPGFYRDRVLPEGFGYLELSHFLLPLAGAIVGIRLLLAGAVRANRHWWLLILLGTLACLYTAGEEHSWGQHIFGWQTPESWGQLNRQNETNLHNVSAVFNMLPRLVLEITILMLGLIVPLAMWFTHPIGIRGLEPFTPSSILVPASIGALVFKIEATVQNETGIRALVMRPSEAAETFYVMFMLFYMILIARRISAIENRKP